MLLIPSWPATCCTVSVFSEWPDEISPADPRLTVPVSPKPLSPPGCTTDGWGRPRPWVVPVGPPLTVAQAGMLQQMGFQLAMAYIYP